MLILNRRVGESITIGEDGAITATILDVEGKQVRLGIDAPKCVAVDRQEIFMRKQIEKSLERNGKI